MPDGANGTRYSRGQDADAYNTFGQLSVADVINFAFRYFWLVVATTSVAITLAIVHILMTAPLYTASGQLLIEVKVPHLANEQWREAGMVLDGAQIESHIAVLQSEPVALSVVRQLDLLNDPAFEVGDTPPSGVAGLPWLSRAPQKSPSPPAAPATATAAKPAPLPSEEERLHSIARRIQGGLGIRRLGFSYVLEVSYTSPDPEFSARLANAFMRAFIEDQIAVRADAARQGSEWLERRINALRLQMTEASRKVQEFKARRDYSIVGRSSPTDSTSEASGTALNGYTQGLEELESTAMTYRRMFESALQAFTEAEQRQSYPVSNARVISSASRPLGKSSPKRKQVLAIATMAGLIFGVGIALLREGLRFARAVRAREDTAQGMS